MANDAVYADLLDALSPVSKAGIDPDEARTDRAGTMAKLMGDPPQPKWYEQAQNEPPVSPNGNALPPGLNSRQAPSAPAVPAGVTPTGDPSTLPQSNTGTINLMQSDYARASQDVQNEASQPDEATVTAPLERQRVSALNRQVELQQPYGQDGKLLPEYKPSFGQRFMRGVQGFTRGGVLGVADPTVAGVPSYGAPNKYLGMDQQQAAGRVAGADQQLKNAQENWKATSDRLKQIATERRALAATGKDVTGAAEAQQKIPIEQQRVDAESQTAANNSPDAKAEILDNAYQQRVRQADAQKLKGQSRTLYIANGKLPDPRQATAEEIAASQATAAWHRDNPGKQPGLEDIRNIQAATRGSDIKGQGGKPFPPALAARISAAKNKAIKAAQETFNAVGNSGRVTNPKSPLVGQKYSKEDFAKDLQAAQNDYEQAIEAAGGSVNHMEVQDDLSWKATAPQAQAPQAAATPVPDKTPAPPKVGDVRKGYVYQGGPPHDKSSWKKQGS